jgi:SAM-dependent methyltransferase
MPRRGLPAGGFVTKKTTVRPQAACPACGSRSVERRLTVREMMFGLGEPFSYASCGVCETLRLVDVPADLGPYYPTDYYSVDLDPESVLGRSPVRQFVRLVGRSRLLKGDDAASAATLVLRKRQFQTLMSLLGSMRLAGLPGGDAARVLDVGSGSGVLVYALTLAGVRDVTGLDPFAAEDRRFDTGARLLKRDIDAITGSYDLVMFHHSFEHVPDPRATLQAAIRLLSRRGRILIRMPTVSSWAYRRYGEHWVQLDAPRHLVVFSRDGMRRLCKELRLDIAAVRDDSTSFQFWGSEQVVAGTALGAPTSHMVNPSASSFTRGQVRAWERRARQLNEAHDGDQAAWVLTPA